MERLAVFRFFKHLLIGVVTLSVLALAFHLWPGSLLYGCLGIIGLIALEVLFHRQNTWIIDLMHAQENSDRLSQELHETNLKVYEKNDLLAAKINELTTLRRITVAMTSTMDLNAILRVILEAVTHDLEYQQACFYISDETQRQWVARQSIGLMPSHPIPETLTLQDDVPLIRPLREKRALILSYQQLEWAAIPLFSKENVVGMLMVSSPKSKKPLHEEDIRSLMTFTHHAGIAVENARLYQTEKHFHEELARQVEIAKAQLLEAQKKLIHHERLAAMGETAALVAHEIKNPLGAIRAAAQLMAHGLPPDDQRYRYMVLLTQEVDRLDRVAQSLLGYAKPLEPRPRQVRIATLIKETLEILQPQLTDNHIDVSLKITDPVPDVEADDEQLKQVLINIIQNAVHAMRGEQAREKNITIHVMAKGNVVKVAITDTGGGVDPAAQARIFEPFFTTRSSGTGLGLAICQRIIDAHGGDIDLQNKVGNGATFIVDIPVQFRGQKTV